MTAALIIGIIALIISLSTTALIAVAVFRALTTTSLSLDKAHARWVKQTERLTNAIIARSPEQFMEMQSLEGPTDDAGFYNSDNEATQVLPPPPNDWPNSRWGSLTSPRRSAQEEKLLAEDFPE